MYQRAFWCGVLVLGVIVLTEFIAMSSAVASTPTCFQLKPRTCAQHYPPVACQGKCVIGTDGSFTCDQIQPTPAQWTSNNKQIGLCVGGKLSGNDKCGGLNRNVACGKTLTCKSCSAPLPDGTSDCIANPNPPDWTMVPQALIGMPCNLPSG